MDPSSSSYNWIDNYNDLFPKKLALQYLNNKDNNFKLGLDWFKFKYFTLQNNLCLKSINVRIWNEGWVARTNYGYWSTDLTYGQ